MILQYLRENGLQSSYETLAAESQVALNSVDNVQNFANDIACGRWEAILPTLAHLKLPKEKLVNLYEHIILELSEMREIETARALLRQTNGPLSHVRIENPKRIDHLEKVIAAPYFDSDLAYGSISRDKRRKLLSDSLSAEVFVVPPARLISLIGQALKWQQHQGKFDKGSFLCWKALSFSENLTTLTP